MSETQGWTLPKAWLRFTKGLEKALIAYFESSRSNTPIETLLTAQEASALDLSWLLNSHPLQRPPTSDDWRTWLLLGGRGRARPAPAPNGWPPGPRRAIASPWSVPRSTTCAR